MAIAANQPAPAFSMPDETGAIRTLEEFRGKPVVLYFYPKDDTPGCTKEACNFRDDIHLYQEAGVIVLGVSPDSVKSHLKFKDKYTISFPLLSDEGHKVCDAYEVWGPKKFMGRSYEGVYRTTFLIGPDGMILKTMENVKPEGHSGEVLALLKELTA